MLPQALQLSFDLWQLPVVERPSEGHRKLEQRPHPVGPRAGQLLTQILQNTTRLTHYRL
jgi:DNA-binding transcriptional regulator LsrR (DeoR family)